MQMRDTPRDIPLGRKALTRTTTLTLPPGSALACGGTVPSRERSDGVLAHERTDRGATSRWPAEFGIRRGSSDMPISVSLMSVTTSRKRRSRLLNIYLVANAVIASVLGCWVSAGLPAGACCVAAGVWPCGFRLAIVYFARGLQLPG